MVTETMNGQDSKDAPEMEVPGGEPGERPVSLRFQYKLGEMVAYRLGLPPFADVDQRPLPYQILARRLTERNHGFYLSYILRGEDREVEADEVELRPYPDFHEMGMLEADALERRERMARHEATVRAALWPANVKTEKTPAIADKVG